MARTTKKLSDRLIAKWLIIMAILVVAMIVVGGATRLTDSGLSITHWSPIHGAIPPLSDADWNQEFSLYKNIPEFKYQNSSMTLNEFKFIFWWEWGHRLLGRIVGLAYLIPLIIFWMRGHIHGSDAPILIGTVLLIGFQGFLGWWMVSSGLQGTNLDVEAIRLSAHLGMAFLLLGILVNGAHFRLSGQKAIIFNNPWSILLLLSFVQIIFGALVAGTDAGLAHNDWPLIDGNFFPNEYFKLEPVFLNFIENTQNIQFNHRILGYILAVLILLQIRNNKKIRDIRHKKWSNLAAFMVLVQIGLGIYTLYVFGKSPPPSTYGVMSGIAHQLSAAILFCLIVLSFKTFPSYRS